jgi:hypothetical protein
MSRADDAAAIRLRHRYRKAVLDGLPGPALPRQAAVRLVGPDCAYHLYPGFRPGDDATKPPPDTPPAPAPPEIPPRAPDA